MYLIMSYRSDLNLKQKKKCGCPNAGILTYTMFLSFECITDSYSIQLPNYASLLLFEIIYSI